MKAGPNFKVFSNSSYLSNLHIHRSLSRSVQWFTWPFCLFIAIECPCLWGHQLARFSKSSLAPKLLAQEMLAKRDRNLTSFKQLFLAQWLLIFPFSSDRKSSVSSKIISKGPHRLKIILRDYRLAFYHFESISVWTKPQVNLVYENQMNSILECSFHPSN